MDSRKQGNGKAPSLPSGDSAAKLANIASQPPISSATPTTVASVTGNQKWDTMYHHLLQYKHKHKDCLVPNRYKHMPQLGSWVSSQRRHYKLKQAGKETPLTQLREELLIKIGFVWATKDPRHVSLT